MGSLTPRETGFGRRFQISYSITSSWKTRCAESRKQNQNCLPPNSPNIPSPPSPHSGTNSPTLIPTTNLKLHTPMMTHLPGSSSNPKTPPRRHQRSTASPPFTLTRRTSPPFSTHGANPSNPVSGSGETPPHPTRRARHKNTSKKHTLLSKRS